MSTRATYALLTCGLRYRLGVQSVVEEQLVLWEGLAREVPDPTLRSLALAKLRDEGDNARSAAMLAAFTPRRHRARVARAIVAAEVLFDYLDGRTEVRVAGTQVLASRRALYRAFTSAVEGRPWVPADAPERGYLLGLSGCLAHELAALPSAGVVAERIVVAAARAAEAQTRRHAVCELGGEQFERWARHGAPSSGMRWDEHAAGCTASVLCVHALVARAAQRSGVGQDPQALDRAYLQLAALAKLLDGLVDGEGTAACGEDRSRLLTLALETGTSMTALGPRHDAILCGLLAHYSATPAGKREPAASILAQLARPHRATVALARLLIAGIQGRGREEPFAVKPTIVASDEPAAG